MTLLSRLLLLLAILGAAPSLAAPKVIHDREFWTEGSYVASNGPWAADLDKSITDYADVAIIGDGLYHFTWAYPDRPSPLGVYGYNYVAYGVYWAFPPAKPVVPIQIGKLRAFQFAYEMDLIRPESANALSEFFVRDASGKLIAEIGWYLSMPKGTIAWFNAGKLIATYRTPGGFEWEIRTHASGAAGLFVMVAPKDRKARLSAVLDAVPVINAALKAGLIRPEHIITGHAFGFEPVGGAGGALIRSFSVTLR